jgi:hypothetical protein
VSPSPAAVVAAAAGPSAVMPQAAVDWARQVCQQQQQQLVDLADRHPDLGLNMSQVAAIANCCLHKLSLVHGPPGTGRLLCTVPCEACGAPAAVLQFNHVLHWTAM